MNKEYDYINKIIYEFNLIDDIDNLKLYLNKEKFKKLNEELREEIYFLQVYILLSTENINSNILTNIFEEMKLKYKDRIIINDDSILPFLKDLFRELLSTSHDPSFLFYNLDVNLRSKFIQNYLPDLYNSILDSSEGFNKYQALIQYSSICNSYDSSKFKEIIKDKLYNYIEKVKTNEDFTTSLIFEQYIYLCEIYFNKDDKSFVIELYNLLNYFSSKIQTIFEFEKFLNFTKKIYNNNPYQLGMYNLYNLYFQILNQLRINGNLKFRKKNIKSYYASLNILVNLPNSRDKNKIENLFNVFNKFFNKYEFYQQVVPIRKIIKKSLEEIPDDNKEEILYKFEVLANSMRNDTSAFLYSMIGTISLNHPNLEIQKLGQKCISQCLYKVLYQTDDDIYILRNVYKVLKGINNKKFLKNLLTQQKSQFINDLNNFKSMKIHFLILLIKHILIVLRDKNLADEYLGIIIKLTKLDHYSTYLDFPDAILEMCNVLIILNEKIICHKYIPILITLPKSKGVLTDSERLHIGENFINLLFNVDFDILIKYIFSLLIYYLGFEKERESYWFVYSLTVYTLKIKNQNHRKMIIKKLITTYEEIIIGSSKYQFKQDLIKVLDSLGKRKYIKILTDRNSVFLKRKNEIEKEYENGDLTELGYNKLTIELNNEFGTM